MLIDLSYNGILFGQVAKWKRCGLQNRDARVRFPSWPPYMNTSDCIFCRMVQGKEPYHLVWEDNDHLAFLSIYPNTAGVTVVVPKEHYSSYIFQVPDQVISKIMKASKYVAAVLDNFYDDVGRTAVVFEGFGVDHLHAKLFPLHGTGFSTWQPITSKINTYFDTYPGYVSSHNSHRVSDQTLAHLARKIRASIPS